MSSPDDKENNPFARYFQGDNYKRLTKQVTAFRETFVLPFRPNNPPVYYHRRFSRVPTIDQCELHDPLCKYEADVQFTRDKKVDSQILKILRRRLTECRVYWLQDADAKCEKEAQLLRDNMQNWFVKYGELNINADVVQAYMKQKHRMIWLRRKRENGEPDRQYRD